MKKLVRIINKRLRLLFTIVALLVALTVKVNGQNNCLRSARTAYDEGRLNQLPALLEDCLDNNVLTTQEEKVEAYKLLALSYLFQDEPEKADDAMLNLLKTNPEFVLNESSDPAEFIALYNSFRTEPIFRYGVKAALNYSYASPISANGTSNLNNPSSVGEYEGALGFKAGIVMEIPLTSKFVLNPEIYASFINFEFDNEEYIPGFSNIISTERQTWIELPVLLQYKLLDKKYNPYIALGATPSYLLASQLELERPIDGNQAVELDETDILELRNQINVSLTVSAGIKFKVGPGFYVAEIRYNHGLLNLSDQENILNSNPQLVFDRRYADSEFSVNTISLHLLGYLFNQYNPKKLK